MNPTHFNASRDEKGNNSWTLVTRLGQMISRAENLYGLRDRSWTILGIEFGPGPTPVIWFPGNCDHIAIRLAPNALEDESLACYQLAHECVHLLAPLKQANASVIEEGLATVFSEDYVLEVFNKVGMTNDVKYIEGAALVRELLMEAPDSVARLRSIEPSFKKLSAEVFAQANLQTSQDNIQRLLAPFDYS